MTHDHYFEKLCEESPTGMDQYKCPKCSHIYAAKMLEIMHYITVVKFMK
jgi:hypothetical protein